MKIFFIFIITVLLVFKIQAQSNMLPSSLWKDQDSIAVFIFLAPECPISQQYTLSVNQLYQLYSKKHVTFTCIFSTDKSKNQKEKIYHFQKKYELQLPIQIDKGFKLARLMQATVTPEVFVWTKTRGILYHGAIDNWFYALGKSRYTITEHYLEDAIKAAIENQPIDISHAAPVGCFLEYK